MPTHLYVAPREGHGWAELRHRLFKLQIEMEWFEKYINNRAYVWEKVPGDEKKDAPKVDDDRAAMTSRRAFAARRLDSPRVAVVQTATFQTRNEEPAWPRRKRSC